MPIIDLSTGQVTDQQADEAEGVTPIEPAAVEPRVIDLNTGAFVAPVLEQPRAEEIQPQETGFADIFTGSERIAATPELGTLPEFGVTEEGDVPRIALGLLSTFDPKAQQDIIQQAIPEAVFETTPDGSTIIEVPTKDGGTRRSVLNRPGFSPQDLTTSIAQVLSFIPAAKVANLGRTLLQKVGVGAAASGATEQALQETGVALGREERDPVGTAVAAATGGLAEAVVPAIQSVRGARQAARVGAEADEIVQAVGNVKQAREATEQTGIPLFKSQQTGVPAQLERQSFVAQLPAGTQSAVKGLRDQNQAAGDAVDTFLNQIAPDDAVITGAERMRTAAQSVIAKLKNIRQEKAAPIYSRAFAEAKSQGALVEISPVIEQINTASAKFSDSGTVLPILQKVKKIIGGADVDKVPKTVTESLKKDRRNTLLRLHNAKMEVDELIAQMKNKGNLGPTAERELIAIQDSLLAQMDSVSPAYKEARGVFADASPVVVKAQDSIVGKVANLSDDQLKQVSSKIFDPAQTNPKVVADAKKAITDVDPAAWDQIIRVELERRLGSIKSTAEAGTVENIPGQLFRAIFPNDKSTKVLMNALDEEGKKNLKYLQAALRRASLGRPGGSQTAGREEIKRELRGGIFNSLRQLFREPLTTITSAGEDAAFNRRVKVLAEALFDPTWKAEIKNIRRFSPKSPEAGRALTQLLNDIEGTEREE